MCVSVDVCGELERAVTPEPDAKLSEAYHAARLKGAAPAQRRAPGAENTLSRVIFAKLNKKEKKLCLSTVCVCVGGGGGGCHSSTNCQSSSCFLGTSDFHKRKSHQARLSPQMQ